MRRTVIAANWKMNPVPQGALDPASPYRPRDTVDVVVFPTMLDIRACAAAGLQAGAQHGQIHTAGYGPHTGDVSMQMLKEAGCTAVLCGHSERRSYHGESERDVCNQVAVALQVGLRPLVCIGESLAEREQGREKDIIYAQLCLLPLDSDLDIAYEPVWAIGTGTNATPEQIQAMHAHIRSLLPESRRETTRILYGGSVKPENAAAILTLPDVDGALVGGASLKPDAFRAIVEAALATKK